MTCSRPQPPQLIKSGRLDGSNNYWDGVNCGGGLEIVLLVVPKLLQSQVQGGIVYNGFSRNSCFIC